MVAAIDYEGFSVVDMWGMCPGRYTKRNKLTPKPSRPPWPGCPGSRDRCRKPAPGIRPGLSGRSRRICPAPPGRQKSSAVSAAGHGSRQEVLILGSAGQRIVTAGEIFCLAGMTAGWQATLKNDYPITVLRGHSVSEMVLSPQPVAIPASSSPNVVVALADEGVARRKKMLARLRTATP
jgi:2-oxoglutarate ferredoxin oxidoreductase subunit beta